MDAQRFKVSANVGSAGRLTIDLSALRANYLRLCATVAPARAAAVVKANAYGLDVARVAPVLDAAGCRDFFVAQYGEALELKPHVSAEARIYVLNGLLPGFEGDCATRGIVPVLNSLEQVENWNELAKARGQKLPALLQFDTGMSRLGLSMAEAVLLAQQPSLLDGVDVRYIMSHLASADEAESPQNAAQAAAMREFAELFPDHQLCFANSGGIFLGSDLHGALVRPGIALYGGRPTDVIDTPMQPVVSLDVPVVQTRTVPAGTLVGYSGAYVAKEERRLATLSVGYADGLPRSLSDRGAVYCDGVRLPIVGRVSMDSLIVDISDLPAGRLKLGDHVEVIGPHQSLEDLAADAGTISYEILTSLGRRFQRRYR